MIIDCEYRKTIQSGTFSFAYYTDNKSNKSNH